MLKPFRPFVLLLGVLLMIGPAGCTLFSEKKVPTLATSTSAEQHERLLWQMVQKQQWNKITPLFSTTLIWHIDGKKLSSDQVVPYLQSLNLKDAVVSDASIQPNGQDMIVTYNLQLSGANAALQNYSVFSIWQQLKNGGYVMVAHSQHALPAASASLR